MKFIDRQTIIFFIFYLMARNLFFATFFLLFALIKFMENSKQWNRMEGHNGKDIMELVNARHCKFICAIIVSLD